MPFYHNRWFSSMKPRTQIYIGAGLITYGLAGSYLTNKAEVAFDMVPTEEDNERLKNALPTIRTLDREEMTMVDNNDRPDDKSGKAD